MDIAQVVTDYGAVLAEPSTLGLVRDTNSLPHSKTEIRVALKAIIAVTPEGELREHLKIAYLSLADFQPLSDEEVAAIREWKSATVAADIEDLGEVAEIVLQLQQRIAEEGRALKAELEAAQLW